MSYAGSRQPVRRVAAMKEVWNEFNFRFDANGSPSEFLIKEVRVTKVGSPGR